MTKDFFSGKRVLVMGLGRFGGGLDSVRFAHQAGARVVVTDLADEETLAPVLEQLAGLDGIEYHLGGHRKEDFSTCQVLVVNPAVAPENEFLAITREAGGLITSQIEIFFCLCPSLTVGITGSNGKSTTTALTAHLLRAGRGDAGYGDVRLSGNIGNRPLLVDLDRMDADDVVVLELSSFQLEQLSRIKRAPDIAVITNLTPNHLDRHGTFQAYCDAKENIFRFQRVKDRRLPVSIFNGEDAICSAWFDRYRRQPDRISLCFRHGDVPASIAGSFPLAGRANLSNLAAALAVARYLGVDDETAAGCIGDFQPLEHRLQLVEMIGGVCWYDDSIATTPPSVIAALEAFQAPKILIAGGYDKKLPFDQLGREIASRCKAVILIGDTAEKIAAAIECARRNDDRPVVCFASSMEEAVKKAAHMAVPGDVVLLSPACASYDMFDNYRQRGDMFTAHVKALRA